MRDALLVTWPVLFFQKGRGVSTVGGRDAKSLEQIDAGVESNNEKRKKKSNFYYVQVRE